MWIDRYSTAKIQHHHWTDCFALFDRWVIDCRSQALVGWLCWGLTSQSTIFQSCRDGAIASWVINQYFRGVKCLAQGHNTAAVGLEPRTSRSGVRHSTTEPPRSPDHRLNDCWMNDGSFQSIRSFKSFNAIYFQSNHDLNDLYKRRIVFCFFLAKSENELNRQGFKGSRAHEAIRG